MIVLYVKSGIVMALLLINVIRLKIQGTIKDLGVFKNVEVEEN